VQIFYLIQTPFYLLAILVVRLISAFNANHILFQATVINLAANIGLNLLFISWFGLPGIALSTTGVYIISFTYVSFRLWSKLRTSDGSG